MSRTLPNLNTETGAVPGHFVEPQLTQTMPRKMPSDTKSYNLDFLRERGAVCILRTLAADFAHRVYGRRDNNLRHGPDGSADIFCTYQSGLDAVA